MYGIVALLDHTHEAKVQALWAEFKAQFGIHGVSLTPVPHFSFHVAERYDIANMERILQKAAATMDPFKVRTNGLGIFTGKDPVLYVPIIRNPTLTALHQRMWLSLSTVAANSSPYYHPDQWRPHITLAHRDADHEMLARLVRLLSEREFYWDITIDTLALLSSHDTPDDTIKLRVKIGQHI